MMRSLRFPRHWARAGAIVTIAFAAVSILEAQAQEAKPNILVIFGDDVGISNISAYGDGLMGYETPNIDRIGKEGIRFLHYYAEQSCTAGRAAFRTGQHGIRTGLTKVGFPGAPMGMSQLDPNLYQDPFERADITSNTFWDWQINHVGQVYGAMDEVFKFAATFKEFPPRSFPPSFVPSTILEETLDDIRDAQKKPAKRPK